MIIIISFLLLLILLCFFFSKKKEKQTLQILSGSCLDDVVKVNYNISRLPGETDIDFRIRVMNSIIKVK